MKQAKHLIFSCSMVVIIGMVAFVLPVQANSSTGISRTSAQIPELQLEAVERKLFAKTFPYDPMEKRLQRLELLVFGTTQFGTKTQRWAQLQSTLAEPENSQSRTKQQSDRSAIHLLEQQVLKKTFPNETAARRLDRLETKVLGQPTPGISIAQRIERLTRITGSANRFENPSTTMRPFGQPGFPQINPFYAPYENLPGFAQVDPQMAEMLQEMQRQMQQFNQHYYFESPDNQSPDQPDLPKSNKTPAPGLQEPNLEELPPYSDPNFI